MLRLTRSLTLSAVISLIVASAASADLFFSEYVEGSSFNKALEIYNATGAAVDLSNYEIRLYSNGAAAPSQTVTLAGVLLADDVFVIAHPSAHATILAQADATSGSVVNFNGDDAVELYKTGTGTVDVIGQIGFDPGAQWGSGLVSTQDNTIRRKGDVCQGDPDGSDPFDPSIEWDGFAQDTFDGLGLHFNACGPTPTKSTSWGRVKTLYR